MCFAMIISITLLGLLNRRSCLNFLAFLIRYILRITGYTTISDRGVDSLPYCLKVWKLIGSGNLKAGQDAV